MKEITLRQADAIEALKNEKKELKETLFATANAFELLKKRLPQQTGAFDKFLYLEQLFLNGTAKVGSKLTRQELLYPSTNNPKFRKPLKEFRDFLVNHGVIGRESNATFARIDYEEAYSIVEKYNFMELEKS